MSWNTKLFFFFLDSLKSRLLSGSQLYFFFTLSHRFDSSSKTWSQECSRDQQQQFIKKIWNSSKTPLFTFCHPHFSSPSLYQLENCKISIFSTKFLLNLPRKKCAHASILTTSFINEGIIKTVECYWKQKV